MTELYHGTVAMKHHVKLFEQQYRVLFMTTREVHIYESKDQSYGLIQSFRSEYLFNANTVGNHTLLLSTFEGQERTDHYEWSRRHGCYSLKKSI